MPEKEHVDGARAVSLSSSDYEFRRFRLWARGFEIPGGFLDEVLEKESYLKELVIALLSRFASILARESRNSKCSGFIGETSSYLYDCRNKNYFGDRD